MFEFMEVFWDVYIIEWIEEKFEKVILIVFGVKFQWLSLRGMELMQVLGFEFYFDIYMILIIVWVVY